MQYFSKPIRHVLGILLGVLAAASAGWARPVVSTLAPTSGVAGSTVTITGTGFGSTAAQNVVYFDGMRATISSASATQLQVIVPNGAVSAVCVRVINTSTRQQGTSVADGAGPFRVTFTPSFSGLHINHFRKSSLALTAGNSLQNMVLADINQDGTADAISTKQSSVLIANGNGAGGFAAPVTLAAGAAPRFPRVVDMTGDGVLDIVALDSINQSVTLLVGQAGGTFAAAQTVYTSPIGWSWAAPLIEDLDQDGLLDLVVHEASSTVLRNTGNNTFAASPLVANGGPLFVAGMADFNQDGRLDLYGYSSTQFTIWPRNAANTAYGAPERLNTGSSVGRVVYGVGDLNMDGRPDVVKVEAGQTYVVVYSRNATSTGFDGGGVSDLQGSLKNVLQLADVNGDGIDDIIMANTSRLVLLCSSRTPSGMFGGHLAEVVDATNNVEQITVGDVNNDGRLDLVTLNRVASGANNASVYLCNIAGTPTSNPPRLNSIPPQSANRNVALHYSVPLTGIDDGDPAQVLPMTIRATSGDVSILRIDSISYSHPATTGTLYYSIVGSLGRAVTVGVTVNNGNIYNYLGSTSFTVYVADPLPTVVAKTTTPLHLFPNPSSTGAFTLQTDPSAGPASLAIVDVLGRAVWTQQLASVPKQLVVTGPTLTPGVYQVRLTTSQGSSRRQLVVE